ncbi:alpha-amylase family glycosyl hydrolase [Synechococcus sp. CCY9201]|uniref:alpha-amylase family glycosyl hydrolase n=1 Tax=Synechococcus sp. CCY9201 TaxID=174697 RepID=UPI002B202A10|nr:alpha-amylase family glycosyl hydrolase [Synechococcus sp. CCY9201]MEA5475501.1 alpha-amylase family glycosyl hydrolase [Synechococcus sp. CCY9201]
MYEQVSHSLLNAILDDLKPEIRRQDLRHFYTRLGANFYAIYSLFFRLYGHRPDFKRQMLGLVETMAEGYINRSPELEALDIAREKDHNWFLSQQWVGMALYTNGFARNLRDLADKTEYFQELGVNMIHVMPILKCPIGKSDGGYAVSDFRQIDDRVGDLEDLQYLASELRQRQILLVLDIVMNHTSDEHTWARKAVAGDPVYQDYYYMYESRDIPDLFERSMPEVFPESSPGNFTWNEETQRWVMTVFHDYQWDLNYSNPEVFIEMLGVVLFWANNGVDIMRLDAVAFLWKEIGTDCQNERNAHLLLQLMKDCCQATAPGVLFIAEAIVAPVEVIKYFGEDAISAKECEIAYNATFMALLWDAVATQNARLLTRGLRSLPNKLDRATWLNYLRCHDDIGFGFDDQDVLAVGYQPRSHRRFLTDFFCGEFEGSPSRGLPFMRNEVTGDARICGSLASLAGLEKAMQEENPVAINIAISRILMLHSLIFSFGGIPLLYNGDALGLLNDYSYQQDPAKVSDNRWVHRPSIDWQHAERRHQSGTVENRLFTALRRMIAIRKSLDAFADFNNRELLDTGNEHLLCFLRSYQQRPSEQVLVVANFHSTPQALPVDVLRRRGLDFTAPLIDVFTGRRPHQIEENILLQSYQFYWLKKV